MKTWKYKLQIFILIIICRSGHAQVSNFIYAVNNTSTGIFYFSKIEIATGVITNLQLVPVTSLSGSESSCINNYSQKYYFCTGSSLITFDAVNGTILSNVPLPISSAASFIHLQFNPCDSAIYGIVNDYPTTISFVRYTIPNNTINIISALNINTFFCSDCMSFLDPDSQIYGFQNLNINGFDISTGQVLFSSFINDLPNETFDHIALKCSTHEIFGTSSDYNANVKYLATINPNTGNITHVSNSSWSAGFASPSQGGDFINQLSGDYYYSGIGHLIIGANTISGNMIYNQTINSGELYLIQHFSQCICGPTGINELKRNLTFNIMPNPSDGNFSIHFNNVISENTIQIFDVTGNLVYQKDKIKNAEEAINLTAAPKGIYFLKVIDKDKTSVTKIVLQ